MLEAAGVPTAPNMQFLCHSTTMTCIFFRWRPFTMVAFFSTICGHLNWRGKLNNFKDPIRESKCSLFDPLIVIILLSTYGLSNPCTLLVQEHDLNYRDLHNSNWSLYWELMCHWRAAPTGCWMIPVRKHPMKFNTTHNQEDIVVDGPFKSVRPSKVPSSKQLGKIIPETWRRKDF